MKILLTLLLSGFLIHQVITGFPQLIAVVRATAPHRVSFVEETDQTAHEVTIAAGEIAHNTFLLPKRFLAVEHHRCPARSTGINPLMSKGGASLRARAAAQECHYTDTSNLSEAIMYGNVIGASVSVAGLVVVLGYLEVEQLVIANTEFPTCLIVYGELLIRHVEVAQGARFSVVGIQQHSNTPVSISQESMPFGAMLFAQQPERNIVGADWTPLSCFAESVNLPATSL